MTLVNNPRAACGLGTIGTKLLPQAFITGSQIYGETHENSDIDLVIRCDRAVGDLMCLVEPAAMCSLLSMHPKRSSTVLRFGKLNLILCHTDEVYHVWEEGTRKLYDVRPVSREHAVKVFQRLREEANLNEEYDPEHTPTTEPNPCESL